MATKEITEKPMKEISIGKVVLNIGVGRPGEAVERAKRLLDELSGQKAGSRMAKKTIRDFGIHKAEPIGVAVTVRDYRANQLLKRLLSAKENRINRRSFDTNGNCSFGIREHIEIPGIKYNPEIGIFGMDVSVVLERPGYRVGRRLRANSRIGKKHRISSEEAATFFVEKLGVEVV